MSMGETPYSFFSRLILTAKINNNVDGHVNIQKSKGCQGCGETSTTIKIFNDRVRNGADISIYYKLDYLSRKICPIEGCNTTWGTYKDLEKPLKYRFHLNEREKGNIPHQ